MQEVGSQEQQRLTGNLLPDEEIHRLMAAVGNHELKALTCIAMRPGVLYAKDDFNTLLNDIQGPSPVWISENGMGFVYCMHSLAPIGLVAKEFIDEGQNTVGFIKTAYGEGLGDAVSGHFLDYSLRYPEFSIIEIFGRTGTTAESGNRSPTATIRIIQSLLAADGPGRISDLLETEKFSNAVATAHAKKLAQIGLITLMRREYAEPIMRYGLAETPLSDLPLRPYKSELPSDVRDILVIRLLEDEFDSITVGQITDDLIALNPDYSQYDSQKLNVQVRQALRYFTRKGAIKNVSDFDNEKQSIIILSDRQRQALSDCMALLEGLQSPSPEFIASGKQKAQQLLADYEAVKTLVAKAREKSPFVGMRTKEQRISYLVGLLRKRLGATVAQLESDTQTSGKRLSQHSIRRMLHELEDEQLATSRKIGKKAVWFLIEQ